MEEVDAVPSTDHTLLLGEGDLSYALALGKLGFNGLVTATELGSSDDVRDRYFAGSGEALARRCDELLHLGIRVVLGVDTILLERNNMCLHYHSESSEFVAAPLWSGSVAPVSRCVYNFPHTTRPGKTAKLLRQAFLSVRGCIARGYARPGCEVEMRLRHVGGSHDEGQLIRSRTGHVEAAAAAGFELVSVSASDLPALEAAGYEHRTTKRAARCPIAARPRTAAIQGLAAT